MSRNLHLWQSYLVVLAGQIDGELERQESLGALLRYDDDDALYP